MTSLARSRTGSGPIDPAATTLFILNSLLELNKSWKLKSYLLLVDLKEVYDRVDRNVLLAKLRQLNFPDRFISFLKDYYFQDNILTSSTGTRSRTQYQKRGLRQGGNLSSVLFYHLCVRTGP